MSNSRTKPKTHVLNLNKGFDWNPLRKYPPNASCFCGSDKKAKRCCLPIQPIAIETKNVEDVKLFMASKLKKS